MTSAESLVALFEEKDAVYEADVVSHTAVVVIEKVGKRGDTKAFFDAADNGWRLGHMVPRESGNVFTFVKMEGRR